jgi:hypothetical protein
VEKTCERPAVNRFKTELSPAKTTGFLVLNQKPFQQIGNLPMYKSKTIRSLLSLSTLFLVICACGNAETSTQTNGSIGEGTETEDFGSFYEQFHADSLFQLDRISWPLNGNFIQDSAGVAKDLHYHKGDWSMHRAMVDNPDFVQQIQPLTEDLYVEEIKARAGKYRIERRFARLSDGWHLIYYRESGL